MSSGEKTESTEALLSYLRGEEEKGYFSNDAVRKLINGTKVIGVGGPSGSGKTTITNEVIALDEDTSEVGTVLTRPLRPDGSDPASFRSVSLEEFAELVRLGEFINFNMIGDAGYGTLVSSLRSRWNIGPITTKSVDTLLNSGLDFRMIYVINRGQMYERLLRDSRIGFKDIDTRIDEGLSSLDFARRNVDAAWLNFVENTPGKDGVSKAARKVIALTHGHSGEFLTRDYTLQLIDEMEAALQRVADEVH